MSQAVCLIEGDGIGPEVTLATRRILDAAGARIEWLPLPAGAGAVERFGDLLPPQTLEAVHGSAPDIAGQNKANPLALVIGAVMMLNHLGQRDAAGRIKDAYDAVLTERDLDVLTPDIGGRGGTTQFADAICGRV